MLPPHLVVEVVSPDERNRDRDYGRKRRQYVRGIPEYWLIDPNQSFITILQLDQGNYLEVGKFEGNTRIQSPKLEQLEIAFSLSAGQIIDAVK